MAWAPDYITEDDLKEYSRIGDEADDAQVALAITAASRAVDRHTNRQFGLVAAPELRRYKANPDYTNGYWTVPVDDFQTTTGLVVEVGDALDVVTVYDLEPLNAAAEGEPWTHVTFLESSEVQPCGLRGELRVTARWGWTAVPPTVAEATLLQASRFLMRRNAPFGVAGSPDLGNEMRLLKKVDPDVAVVLRPYKRALRAG
jgi:hypothetical protein